MRGRDQGYTILEALCAFAILALLFTSLFGMSAVPLRAADRALTMTEATLFAESKLQEVASLRSPLHESDYGTAVGGALQWRLDAHVIPQLSSAQGLLLQDVRLVVSWQSADGDRDLTFTTRHLGATRQ
jgi:type II secretory pathway pseudopilin PulG